jgi:hypothetical protein
MAAGDFALLTAISIYPNEGYSSLDGPPNDLTLVKDWLRDPAGGGLTDDQIVVIASPNPYPKPVDPDIAPPVSEDFDREFKKLRRRRMDLKRDRVQGRLYLYFSGHGFCHRSQEKPAEAALYSANATKGAYDHIFGTHYARVALGQALFGEIVLIMDCCRDSEITRVPVPKPYSDVPDDGLAADVKLMCVYAVPKGGKAQERKIPEREDRVYGLLTHALVKALKEARPSDGDRISSVALRAHIQQSWTAICGTDVPRPEIYVPPSGDIYFPAQNVGTVYEFRFTPPVPPGRTITLRDGDFIKVAELPLAAGAGDLLKPNGPVRSVEREADVLRVRLEPGFYEYETSDPVKKDKFKVEGAGGHADV